MLAKHEERKSYVQAPKLQKKKQTNKQTKTQEIPINTDLYTLQWIKTWGNSGECGQKEPRIKSILVW